jgi:PTS system mannose-specific IID component
MEEKVERNLESQELNNEVKIVKKLDRKDVIHAFVRWSFLSHTNYNYERLQASMFTSSMKPVLKKLYGDDPDAMKEALQRHMAFFNTEPHFGGVIHGIVIAMEEQKANGAKITTEAINGIKTGLMGPFAGVGDTLWQGTIVPILLAIGISMGMEGNLMGPLLYIVLLCSIMWTIGFKVWMKGYDLGTVGIQKILDGNLIKSVIMGASILGATVLGALSASFVTVNCPLIITIGKFQLNLQDQVFDTILKGILPLSVTFITYYLLKNKKMKGSTVMLVLFVVSLVLGLLGILG